YSNPEHRFIHALGAGDREAAARYALAAAEAASRTMAFDQAASLYRRALELGDDTIQVRRELGTRLGEALARAGRGADAARVYREAARDAAADDALELKRRAAEALLTSGHVEEGKALLREVLGAIGLGLPRGPRTAVLALLWERTRLRL